MATGYEVLFISFGGLMVLWAIVIYGSSFFGSR
jgi:hypothetical protein